MIHNSEPFISPNVNFFEFSTRAHHRFKTTKIIQLLLLNWVLSIPAFVNEFEDMWYVTVVELIVSLVSYQ